VCNSRLYTLYCKYHNWFDISKIYFFILTIFQTYFNFSSVSVASAVRKTATTSVPVYIFVSPVYMYMYFCVHFVCIVVSWPWIFNEISLGILQHFAAFSLPHWRPTCLVRNFKWWTKKPTGGNGGKNHDACDAHKNMQG